MSSTRAASSSTRGSFRSICTEPSASGWPTAALKSAAAIAAATGRGAPDCATAVTAADSRSTTARAAGRAAAAIPALKLTGQGERWLEPGLSQNGYGY
eukprot:754421-Lingulodinium_polyedra.AAC.1